MCGIHGFFGHDKKLIKEMLKASESRGPDGEDIYIDDYLSLGHNLLAITDKPENSKQPWKEAHLIILFNGEIFNYQELSENFNLKTTCDTELLAKGILSNGIDFLQKIDGMYALIIYDTKKDHLYLARDHCGIKPLYYCYNNNHLFFSSSIKSLFKCPISNQLDKIGFELYNNFGFVPGRKTLLKDIKKLKCGEVLTFSVKTKKLIKEEYKIIKNTDSNIEDLKLNINNSVNNCLLGIRNTGLLLSGGMDSSIILHELALKLKTFNTRFNCKEYKYLQDSDLAKFLSWHYKMQKHIELKITLDEFLKNLESSIYAIEFPRYNRNIPIYYLMYQAINKENITVILSGEGGDEVFTGYKKYHSNVKKGDLSEWIDQNKFMHKSLSKKALEVLHTDIKSVNFDDVINNMLYLGCITTLADEFLERADKLGMNFSIETRFPYLTKSFMQYILNIPSQYKIINNKLKQITKQTYKNILPYFVINKIKTGWSIPWEEWFKTKQFIKQINYYLTKDYYAPTHCLLPKSFKNPKVLMAFIYFQIWAKQFSIIPY